MAEHSYAKYWIVTAAAVVVFVVVLFWKPSISYNESIYREPNYVQEPYVIQSTATCGSLWNAATGGLTKALPPQYPPPSTESAAQYLLLYSQYENRLTTHPICDDRRSNFGLILAAAAAIGITSEVLRRRKRAADATTGEPTEVPSLVTH